MSHPTAPFKFLDSYQKEDKEVFFGREAETDALYDALSGVKHLLVYGPSGAGKTSLIECGLRNQFSDADWFALTIRRGSDMAASVFARINEALQHKIKLQPKTGLPSEPETDFGEAIEALFSERYQPVYLLFDQFEELLISGREEEKRDFFTRLDRLIRYKVPCRVLLIMREEFIGHLSEFEPLCPSIFQHRFRLEKMRRSAVQRVIQDMLKSPRYRAFFEVANSQSLASAILSKLPDQRQEIELAHVQVFLSELWDRADKTAPRPLLHEGLVKPTDNLETVLDSFLKKQLTELEPTHGDKAPLELLAAMISERHTKLQLGEAALQQELDEKGVELQKSLLDLLQDLKECSIIRELKSGEVKEYEISHDVLAKVVGLNFTEDMRMQWETVKVYRLYERGEGFLSQEAIDELRFYQAFKPFSERLERRFIESMKHIDNELQEKILEAQQRVEVQQGLREQAEISERKAQKRLRTAKMSLAAAGVALLSLLGVVFYAVHQRDVAEEAVFRSAVITTQLNTSQLLFDTISNTINYDSIVFLSFKNFNLNKIPRQVFKLKNLIALDLSGNDLTNLSTEIGHLRNLTSLYLNNTNLTNLPPEIGRLKSLSLLDLGDNQLTSLPPEIGNLKNLISLKLSSNQLANLPDEIGNLKNLTWLYIDKNQLTSLPPEIGNLKNLIELDLWNNSLKMVPFEIGHLKNLNYLNLSINQLTSLPTEIGKLKNLTKLDLRGNTNLNFVSLCIAFSTFSKPIILTFDELETDVLGLLMYVNVQDSLPGEIGKLESLVILDLHLKDLTSLPSEIGLLNNLSTLYLNGNQLSSLPGEIGQLKKLTSFDLSDNQLVGLPEEIEELKNLTSLDLRWNPIPAPEQEKIKNLLPWCEVQF